MRITRTPGFHSCRDYIEICCVDARHVRARDDPSWSGKNGDLIVKLFASPAPNRVLFESTIVFCRDIQSSSSDRLEVEQSLLSRQNQRATRSCLGPVMRRRFSEFLKRIFLISHRRWFLDPLSRW
jgi:hypothetical protein